MNTTRTKQQLLEDNVKLVRENIKLIKENKQLKEELREFKFRLLCSETGSINTRLKLLEEENPFLKK